MTSLGRASERGGVFLIKALPGVVMTIRNCHGTDGRDVFYVNEILMKSEICSPSNQMSSWLDLVPVSFHHILFISLGPLCQLPPLWLVKLLQAFVCLPSSVPF